MSTDNPSDLISRFASKAFSLLLATDSAAWLGAVPTRSFRRSGFGQALLLALFLIGGGSAMGQLNYAMPYTFSTLAGSAGPDGGWQDGTGTTARFSYPEGIVVDSHGNVFVVDNGNRTIRKITPAAEVTTFAGSYDPSGYQGSLDGTGTAARFTNPWAIALDAADNLYVADANCIRKITPTGVVTTFAGNAAESGSADGPASDARFYNPRGVAVDPAGNVFVADAQNQTIRRIALDGTVSTFAGQKWVTGTEDGVGSAAHFNFPAGMTADSAGNIYVFDSQNRTVRKITPAGSVGTLAGQPGAFYSWADGTGSEALFDISCDGMAVDHSGNVYVADCFSNVIRKITPGGVVTTPVGSPYAGGQGCVDGVGREARFYNPAAVAIDADGNLYVSDNFNRIIRKVTPDNRVTTFAGNRPSAAWADGVGAEARLFRPVGIVVDDSGNLYVADSFNGVVRKIAPDGAVTTIAGLPQNYLGQDCDNPQALPFAPYALARDAGGNLYVGSYPDPYADAGAILKITPGGAVSWFADIPIQPTGLAVDAAGNVYCAGLRGGLVGVGAGVIKISPQGVYSLFVGNMLGYADGQGSAARFNYPEGLAIDRAGVLYVADYYNGSIRKITPDGMVTTLAGRPDPGDPMDGTGSGARFGNPCGVAVDQNGNVFVSEMGSDLIRRVTPDGVVTTVAGLNFGSDHADGTGPDARFWSPRGIAVDAAGNLYVADTENNTIRKGHWSGQPVFVSQPGSSMTVDIGGAATFAAGASGRPAPSYRWQISYDRGGSWYDLADDATYSGSATATLVVSNATFGMDGHQFRCVATNGSGSACSAAAVLVVRKAPEFTVQPADQVAAIGQAVTFHVAALGNPPPNYRWQRTADAGAHWSDLPDGAGYSGTATGTLALTSVTAQMLAEQYRCVATNVLGTATSNAVSVSEGNAPDLDNWVSHSAPGVTAYLYAVAWGDNKFVAVGMNGTIISSPDGITWTLRQSGTPNNLSGVVWTGNHFVAVGYLGTVLTSPDGISWTGGPSGTGANLGNLAWGGNLLVATSGGIYVSGDGITWASQSPGVAWSSSIVCVTAGPGRFVAGGTGGAITSSPDGITWTGNSSGNAQYTCAVWGGDQFVLLGNGFSPNTCWVLTSPDGISWTPHTTDSTHYPYGAAWGWNHFVSVGNGPILSSTDGVNWVSHNVGSYSLHAVAWGGGRFVAVGYNGTILTTAIGSTPTFANQPASQSTPAGQSATFVVSASGSPAPTYQWQMSANGGGSWSVVVDGGANPGYSGAASATLTITGTTRAMNGYQYRCVATSGVGSATSDTATLTVAKFAQSITFAPLPFRRIGDGPFTVNASASSGLPVSFGIVSGPATIAGDSVGLTGRGIVIVRASQSGDGTYAAAISVDRAFAVVPEGYRVAGDFDGNGQPDMIWQDATTGERKVWLMNGSTLGTGVSLGVVGTAWQIAGAADFNGDGQTDILWQNTQTGERGIWLMIGTNVADWASLGTMPVEWQIAAAADFNGDGKVDLLLENTNTGERKVRLMNGTTLGAEVSLGVVPTAWRIAAAADFNGDGQADILFENTRTGERGIWLMIGTNVADWASLGTVPLEWQMTGAQDFNGDGHADILFDNTRTGERGVWLMIGTNVADWVSLGTTPTAWHSGRWDAASSATSLTADFNGDGQADLVWQNASTGERKVWLMNGTTLGSEVSLGVVPTAWQIVGAADFNGDRQTDILFENTQTGERGIWLMIGTNVADWASLGTMPVEWRIATVADFNGDGKADLLLENTSTGERKVRLMNGTTLGSEISLGVVPTAWQIAGAADFNGDGQTDILWQNTRTGERGVWLMIGTDVADWASLGTVPVAWRMVAALDLNGDGHADILWEDGATGEREVWLMNGTTNTGYAMIGVVAPDWQIRN